MNDNRPLKGRRAPAPDERGGFRAPARARRAIAVASGLAIVITGVGAAPIAMAADAPAIIAGSAGGRHSLALDATGTMWSWGDRSDGKLGDGEATGQITLPKAITDRGAIPAGVAIVEVLAVGDTSRALGDDGEVYAWGGNPWGQLGDGTTTDRSAPTLVAQGAIPAAVKIVDIDATSNATYALGDDGLLYAWGLGGTLGTGTSTDQPTPVAVAQGAIPAGVKIVDVAAGGAQGRVTVIGDDGKAYGFGPGGNGALGNGANTASATFVATAQGEIPAGVKLLRAAVLGVAGGTGGTVAIGDDGRAYTWGDGSYGQLANGVRTTTQNTPVQALLGAIPAGVKLVDVDGVGGGTVVALGDDGKAYAWGRNQSGQLGDGVTPVNGSSTGAALLPVAVAQGEIPAGVRLTSISAEGVSGTTVSALGDDGKLYGWGENSYGQLGDGSTVIRNTPVLTQFGADPTQAQPTALTVSVPDVVVEDANSILVAQVSPTAGGFVTFSAPSKNEVFPDVPVVNGLAQLTFVPRYYGATDFVATFTPDKPLQFQASTVTESIEVIQSPVPKITTSNGAQWFAGTRGATDNPPLTVTIVDGDTPADQLTVEVVAQSQSQGYEPVPTVTGSGSTRTISMNPDASENNGQASVDIIVTDPEGNRAQTRRTFVASATPASPSAFYYYGDSDAAAAVDAGDGYVLIADDDDQIIKLYKGGETAYTVKEFPMPEVSGVANIESAVRRGDTIYWVGSFTATAAAQRTIFTTTVTGSGADTEVVFGALNRSTATAGFYSQLKAWDATNAHGLGANALKIGNSTTFSIGGAEFAPGSSSTAYLGFSTSTIPVDGINRALIVPVTNFEQTVADNTVPAAFGAPILLDLGGRGIYDLRKNASDQYVIIAGGGSRFNAALYTWNGDAQSAPVFNRDLPVISPQTGGIFSAVAPLPNRLKTGDQIELITDSGDALYYGSGNASGKAREVRKAYADTYVLGEVPVLAEAVATATSLGAVDDALLGAPVLLSASVTPADAVGVVQFRDGDTVLGETAVVSGAASFTTSALALGAHELTATFVPADADAFTGSVSAAESVTIAPAPSLELEPTVSSKMLAGKAYLTVSVRNADDVVADVTVTTPFGSKTFVNVAPGSTVSVSLNTRAAALPAGVATVTGTATDSTTFESTVPFGG